MTDMAPDAPRTTAQARIITFYSYKGGAGRTMALANIAWLFASIGKRVLVVDWDLEAPGLHRYFRPFLTDPDLTSTPGVIDMLNEYLSEVEDEPDTDLSALRQRCTDLTDRTQAIKWAFPDGGRIDLLSAGRQDPQYEIGVTSFPWPWFFEAHDGTGYIEAFRRGMRDGGYDYIFIDSRTGVSDVAGLCTRLLPETVVLCFTLNNQAIEGCARVAASIRELATRPVNIVPVPTRVEDGETERREARIAYAREHLREVLDDFVGGDGTAQTNYLDHVAIPHRTLYAYEELLAVFGETPGARHSVLGAYWDLAQRLLGRKMPELHDLPTISPKVRARIRARFAQLAPVPPETVHVFADPRDRAWKDWVSAQLRNGGLDVRDLDQPVPSVEHLHDVEALLVIVSPHLTATTPNGKAVKDWIERRLPGITANSLDVVGARIADGKIDKLYDRIGTLSLIARPEPDAQQDIWDQYGLAGSARSDVSAAARFPGRRPVTTTAPHRDQRFVGRDALLEEMRDRLMPGSAVSGPVALVGAQGIGKSGVAQEFAHRFAADYDVVWWIDARTEAAVRRHLADLAPVVLEPAEASDVDAPRDQAQDIAAVLDALRRGLKYERWLLVYDNAELSPEALEPLIPQTSPFGHVIVSSTDDAWDYRHRALVVRPLARAESKAYLNDRLDLADDAVLDEIAEYAGDVPFELVHAGTWIRNSGQSVAEAVAALRTRKAAESSGARPDRDVETDAVPAAWGLLFDSLRQDSDPVRAAAARILELCAVLSRSGVSTDLLTSPATFGYLADASIAQPALDDPDQVLLAVQAINQRRLADVHHGTGDGHGMIKLHNVARNYLRSCLRSAQPERFQQVRDAALKILAAYAPQTNLERADVCAKYWELQKHVNAVEAADSLDTDVRRWLVYQLYYLWRIGRWNEARILGERCLKVWGDAGTIGPDDPIRLRMATQLANALRSLGQFRDALKIDEATLVRQRRLLGADHPHTLVTALGLGADKRALGWYQAAWAEEQATWRAFERTRGADAPSTLNAKNNLALSVFLAGQLREALKLNREVYERRRMVLGSDHPYTLWSRCRIAICQRELGEYDEAHSLLTDAADRLTDHEGPFSHFTLRARKHQAVALRLLEDRVAAKTLTTSVFNVFLERYGREDPGTIACRLSLAADHHGLGETADAEREANECLETYRKLYGEDHPTTLACRSNLSVYVRATGDPASAVDLAAEAYEGLTEKLYEHHPHTIAAAVNYANARYAWPSSPLAGGFDAASVEEAAYAEASNSLDLGPAHPYTQVLEYNRLAVTQSAGDGESNRVRKSIELDVSTI